VALVLMKDGMSAAEAINLIRDRRSKNALCNPHFVEFLLDYETNGLERVS